MLTKEEREYLMVQLNLLKPYHVEMECSIAREYLDKLFTLFGRIHNLTEKPKRKIQVGDIYLDEMGGYIEITQTDVPHPIAHIRGRPINSPIDLKDTFTLVYDEEGIKHSFYKEKGTRNLILDKRYTVNIEEVKDVG